MLSASGSLTVADFVRTATEQLKSVTQQQADSQRRYAEFTKLREESANLAQRLRDVASQMLKNAANSDMCPLCHTQFQPGELANHMHAGIDQQAETKASEMLNAIREGEVSIKRAEASDKAARWAFQACKRFGEPSSITASRLLELVLGSQKEAEVQTRLRTQANDELAGLQKLGLTTEGYHRLLAAAAVEKEPMTAANIREKCKSLEFAKSDKATEMVGYTSKSQELLADALKTLNLVDAKPKSVESALSQLKEQVVTTEGFLSKLEPHLKALPWPPERPLSELAIAIGTVRQVAGDFQQTLSKERGSVKALTEASNQKKQIETRLLRRFIAKNTLEVLVIDPLYLAMNIGESAGNHFVVGQHLKKLSTLCRESGCQFALVHHATKASARSFEGQQPPCRPSGRWLRRWGARLARRSVSPLQLVRQPSRG